MVDNSEACTYTLILAIASRDSAELAMALRIAADGIEKSGFPEMGTRSLIGTPQGGAVMTYQERLTSVEFAIRRWLTKGALWKGEKS